MLITNALLTVTNVHPPTCRSCPLCRAELEYFAAPCAPLYQYVATRFYEEVSALETEAHEQEQLEFHARSVSVPVQPGRAADLSCIVCQRQQARRGLVSVCGHIFCEGCFPEEPRKSLCPAGGCDARLIYRPKPCQLLLNIAGERDDGERRTGTPGTDGAGGGRRRAEPEAQASSVEVLTGALGAVAVALADGDGSGRKAPPYTHFGVSCDGCGVYPINGRAFRCRDCPEEVGYDLCEYCYSDTLHGKHAHIGRFGQAHRADHTMEERLQVVTASNGK